jgi:predicted SnoaL-like aldol condensation-catalyzing enzyme
MRALPGAALLLMIVASPACVTPVEPSHTLARCDSSTQANRRLVNDFYQQALIDKQVRAAFERYVAPDFIEHKPDIPGGTRASAIIFLEGLVKDLPGARWEVLRTVAEGDMVAIHARFTPAPGAPAFAIADFFGLQNCQIVEHWDVVGPPTDKSGNPNPRF